MSISKQLPMTHRNNGWTDRRWTSQGRKPRENSMRNRTSWLGLMIVGIVTAVTGCSNPKGLDSITISPTTQALTTGQTAQFTATGTYGNANHLSHQTLVSGVNWTSNTPSVATIDANGIATAVGAGTATITASAAGFAGPVSATATLTVSAVSGGGQTGGSVVSLAIIPGSQSVAAPTDTSQFLAIGTTSSGATENLTNQVAWASSSQQIATIGATTGFATAVGQGTATITALYTNATNGTAVTGVATFTVSGGSSEQVTALTIIPGSESLSASGQTGQLIALGTSGSNGTTLDVTSSPQLTWSSSIPSIATVSSTGLAKGLAVGNTTITAVWTNNDNSVVTAAASISVSLTSAPEPILSLQIVPSALSVGDLQDTGQFLAIGTFSTVPYVRDLTNSPTTTWISSFPEDFPVSTNSGGNAGASGGLVTAYASGSATIIAESASTDGTIQTATAQFNCPLALPNPGGDPPTAGSCFSGEIGPLLATITVYAEGLNNTNWLITAPSATGTQNVIHCGPGWAANGNAGGSVCTATYPLFTNGGFTTVTLTAPAQAGVAFGGWSSTCTPLLPVNAAGPNSCTITLAPPPGTAGSFNESVSAVFN
jgi:uncharacterized protein YjdB